jgi:hypothetical protein
MLYYNENIVVFSGERAYEKAYMHSRDAEFAENQ